MNIALSTLLAFNFLFSDAIYFGRLESALILVHMEPAVIKLMAAYVYMAILKDIWVNCMIYDKYLNKGTDCKT